MVDDMSCQRRYALPRCYTVLDADKSYAYAAPRTVKFHASIVATAIPDYGERRNVIENDVCG